MSLCNYVKTNSHFKATGLELRNFGQYFILVYIEKTLNENMLHSCVNYEYLLKYVFVLYEATFFTNIRMPYWIDPLYVHTVIKASFTLSRFSVPASLLAHRNHIVATPATSALNRDTSC